MPLGLHVKTRPAAGLDINRLTFMKMSLTLTFYEEHALLHEEGCFSKFTSLDLINTAVDNLENSLHLSTSFTRLSLDP